MYFSSVRKTWKPRSIFIVKLSHLSCDKTVAELFWSLLKLSYISAREVVNFLHSLRLDWKKRVWSQIDLLGRGDMRHVSVLTPICIVNWNFFLRNNHKNYKLCKSLFYINYDFSIYYITFLQSIGIEPASF